MRIGLAVLALVLSSASRADAADSGPAARDATWRELRTEHFVLSTDLPPDDAAALATLIERAFEAVLATVPGAPAELEGRLPVVAFSRWHEFQDLAPRNARAYFMAGPSGEAAIVLVGDLDRDLRAVTLGHELTHYVLARTFQWQPYWVNEGLAKNMEGVLGRAGAAQLPGEPHDPRGPSPELLRDARRPNRASAAAVLATDRPERMPPGSYTTSWLLVRYLLAEHREAFGAYMRRRDRREDPAAAWRAEFPGWDPASPGSVARLDEALSAYARAGAPYERPAPAGGARPSAPTAERVAELGPPQVRTLRIRLLSQADSTRARVRLDEEIAQALAEDPSDVAALWARSGPSKVGLATARSATARHPGDGRAWLLLAGASSGDEREAALRRAAELSGDDAAALGVLARERRRDRRFEDAWPPARRAAELAPWSAFIADTLADVALEVAPCPDVIALASRALELSPPDAADSRWRTHASRRLERSWQLCAPLLVGPHGERRPPPQAAGPSPAPTPAGRTPP